MKWLTPRNQHLRRKWSKRSYVIPSTLYLLCSIPFGIHLVTTWAAYKSCSYPHEWNIWTQCRTLTEELDKAVLAIWLVILLLEGSFVELFKAEGTDKVLWMELLPHSSNTTASNWLLAARTQRSTAFMIMNLTVWLPIMFKETSIDKWSKAFLGEKKTILYNAAY